MGARGIRPVEDACRRSGGAPFGIVGEATRIGDVARGDRVGDNARGLALAPVIGLSISSRSEDDDEVRDMACEAD